MKPTDHLIYGKSDIQGVVSLEDNGDESIKIYKCVNGETIEVEVQKNSYWILTAEPMDKLSVELEGKGFYKYKNLFSSWDEFDHGKKHCYRNRRVKDKFFCVSDPREMFMLQSGVTYYKGLKHGQVSVLSFDLETTTLEHTDDAKILIISNTFRDGLGNIERKLFCYDDYTNPKELIEAWCQWVQERDPSIVTGHNIYNFDLPYLAHVASDSGASLTLGREGKVATFNEWNSKFRKDATQFYEYKKCFIPGREIIDTFFLAIKYDIGRKYESYGLKPIIKHEGLEVKDRVFYDASQIRFKYKDPAEWPKIKQYALHDADDALALWDLMGPPYFYMAQSVPKTMQEIICSASGAQLNAMMIRNYLQENHSLPKASESVEFEGAISIGNPGIFRNVLKFDVASLYPSIMIQYEVYDKEKDPKGYFKELVNTFTALRLQNKKLAKKEKYYDDLQSAQKIFINSCYGFLGAQGLLFNSPSNAAFITRQGREILTKALTWASDNKLTVVNADTDSVSVAKSTSEPLSEDTQQALLKELQSLFPDRIKWEHDGYYQTVVVLKAKNYILYDGKSIKIKGSALKDQKKEAALREFLDKMVQAIIDNKANFTEIYHRYVMEIMNVKDIKRWSSKKTITDKTLNSERTNETKVKDAIKGTEYKEADKIWVFFKSDSSLCLAEKFDGDYDKRKLLEKLYKTSLVFESILPVKELFPNYYLKRNAKFLENLTRGVL